MRSRRVGVRPPACIIQTLTALDVANVHTFIKKAEKHENTLKLAMPVIAVISPTQLALMWEGWFAG